MNPAPPRSPLFPYTTLFRSNNPSEHERHVFVTRSGEVIFGKIYSISPDGNTITFDRREGGRQDLSADQLARVYRSEEHTSELQSRQYLVCRLLLEKKKSTKQ